MTYAETRTAVREKRAQIGTLHEELRALQNAVEAQPVENYAFETQTGETTLAKLFGDKADLFVVHNMGVRCSSCTMWADGFNGVYPHLANRAAFVVVSDDPLDVQRRFAADRGWRFPMARAKDVRFHADMGYWTEKDRIWPGVSVFHKDGERIVRVSDAEFGPGDDFCSVYHLLDMIPRSDALNYSPKFHYVKV
jgi:predicted dithiol-disulfide oxidoreductase (DUF899 family)